MTLQFHQTDIPTTPIVSRYVKGIYQLSTDGQSAGQETAAVTGAIGLSFTINGYAEKETADGWERIPRACAIGLFEKPQYFRTSSDYREITVLFDPYQLQHFHTESMSCVSRGAIVNAKDLFDPGQLDRLADALADHAHRQNLSEVLTLFLESNFRSERTSERIERALELIRSGKVLSVNALAEQLAVSTTTLRNDFRHQIGVSPKCLIRMHRIHRVLRQNWTGPPGNLTALAQFAGYFDQAHFVHEFRQVMGMSPKQYFKNANLISDFYNYGRWIRHRLQG